MDNDQALTARHRNLVWTAICYLEAVGPTAQFGTVFGEILSSIEEVGLELSGVREPADATAQLTVRALIGIATVESEEVARRVRDAHLGLRLPELGNGAVCFSSVEALLRRTLRVLGGLTQVTAEGEIDIALKLINFLLRMSADGRHTISSDIDEVATILDGVFGQEQSMLLYDVARSRQWPEAASENW